MTNEIQLNNSKQSFEMLFKMYFVLVVIAWSCTVFASSEDDKLKGDHESFKKPLDKECAASYSVTCFKLDVVNFVDKLNNQMDFNVLPGVSLVRETRSKTNKEMVAEVVREFPNNPDSRLDAVLMNKLSNYLNTHSIKFNLFNPESEVTARKGDGLGGGGGKKGGGLGMLLAAGSMMGGTLMALAMGGLAALAGKALMTGLMSLMLSAIIGLKSLSSGGGKQTTYEVIAQPVYSHGSSHSSSHEDYGGHGQSSYGRSYEVPLPLGLQPEYQTYKPEVQS